MLNPEKSVTVSSEEQYSKACPIRALDGRGVQDVNATIKKGLAQRRIHFENRFAFESQRRKRVNQAPLSPKQSFCVTETLEEYHGCLHCNNEILS